MLTSLSSPLRHRQREHFVFIFDYIVKTNGSPESKNSIYPQNKNKGSSSSWVREQFKNPSFGGKIRESGAGMGSEHPTKNAGNGQGAARAEIL